MRNVFQVAVLQVNREIKEDGTSLKAQLRYYEYLQDNIAIETGSIDRKIEKLLAERERKVEQFSEAPKRIRELKLRMKSLDVKRNKLLFEPRMNQLEKLKKQIAVLECQ